VRRFRPRFIATDARIRVFQELASEPEFLASYRVLESWSERVGRFVVFERRTG